MLYMKSDNRLDEIPSTSLGEEGILERRDLQRILRDQPEVIEHGLFVVDEEFNSWTGSGRSIDLLGIGEDGRLVVVELKRGNTGEHMELQAIRYAAMAANMTLQQIIDAHSQYLLTRGIDEDAGERVRSFLAGDDDIEEPQVETARPRILLVSEDFSKEITTSVLWLNEAGLDIRCVRLRAYRHEEEVLIDVDQVIPLPEAEEYLVRVRDRDTEAKRHRTSSTISFEGSGHFEDSIPAASKEHQPRLKELLEWARSIEASNHARLLTTTGSSGFGLSLRVPSQRSGLIKVVYPNDAPPYLTLYWTVVQRLAPRTLNLLEEAVGGRIGPKRDVKEFDSRFLALVKQAYEEAKGQQFPMQESNEIG